MPAGRPTKKTPFSLSKIVELTKEGKTSSEISEIMGFSRSTIQKWIDADYEYAVTIRKARLEADEMIEKALYERAHGYKITEEDQVVTQSGVVVDVKRTKHIPPDTQAMKFWLMNRQRDKWTDKSQLEVTGKNGEAFKMVIEDYRLKQNVIDVTPSEDLLQIEDRAQSSVDRLQIEGEKDND